MSKPTPTLKTRSSSLEHKKKGNSTISKRPTADYESMHLGDLKEKSKKLVKKLISNQPVNYLKKIVQKGTDSIKK